MADSNRIDFLDEVPNEIIDEVHDEFLDEVSDEVNDEVSDEVSDEVTDEVSDEVPDEVPDAKVAAAEADKDIGGDTNNIEMPLEEVPLSNVIEVRDNCQEGFRMGPDGVCREVF